MAVVGVVVDGWILSTAFLSLRASQASGVFSRVRGLCEFYDDLSTRDLARQPGIGAQLAAVRGDVDALIQVLREAARKSGSPLPPPPPPPSPPREGSGVGGGGGGAGGGGGSNSGGGKPRCSSCCSCCWRLCCAASYMGKISRAMEDVERGQRQLESLMHVHQLARAFKPPASITVPGAARFWSESFQGSGGTSVQQFLAAYKPWCRQHYGSAGATTTLRSGPVAKWVLGDHTGTGRVQVTADALNRAALAYGWPLGSGEYNGGAPPNRSDQSSGRGAASRPMRLPSSLQALQLEADAAFAMRDFDGAVKAYSVLLRGTRECEDLPAQLRYHALVQRGRARLKCEELGKALADAEAAGRLSLSFMEHRLLAARVAVAQGNWERANTEAQAVAMLATLASGTAAANSSGGAAPDATAAANVAAQAAVLPQMDAELVAHARAGLASRDTVAALPRFGDVLSRARRDATALTKLVQQTSPPSRDVPPSSQRNKGSRTGAGVGGKSSAAAGAGAGAGVCAGAGVGSQHVVVNLAAAATVNPDATASRVDLKLVAVGAAGVGKTSLLRRAATKSFSASQATTVAAEVFTKAYAMLLPRSSANTRSSRGSIPAWCQLTMWDTAGQERFKSLLPMYLRGAHIALLCYSVTDIHSFENLESVIHMVQEQCGQDVVLVVVGCKADLAPEGEPRQGRVPFASAIEFAERVGGLVFETSAKNGDGVDEALFAAAEMAVAAKRRKGDPVVKGLQVGGTRGSGTGPSGACLC